jgi:hypothetical protein
MKGGATIDRNTVIPFQVGQGHQDHHLRSGKTESIRLEAM